jgi:hypothetical protein
VIENGTLVTGLRVVRTGLQPTDQVVIDGLAVLQPGATVQPALVELKPRAADTSPSSQPLTAPPSSEAQSP